MGKLILVEMSVFADRSFTYITKTPPASSLILEYAKLDKGSGEPNKEKVGKLSKKQVKDIAEIKMPDLNAMDIDAAMEMVKGTARSMGVNIKD